MSAAVSTRPCAVCLRPVPVGGACVKAASHAAERAKVERRNRERRAAISAWKARGRELERATPADAPLVIVALVGCGKVKAEHAARVRELYRSPLFAKSLALAELAADHVFVASASRSSLLELEEVVEPYEARVHSFDRERKAAWAHGLVGDLASRFPGVRVKLVLLMGETYADPIVSEVSRRMARHSWPAPVCLLERLTVGRRLAFLNAAISAARVGRGSV